MSAPFWRWQGRSSQEMLTLPGCSSDVEGPTHTQGSTGGGDLSEPKVSGIELRDQSQVVRTVLQVPPKNTVFPVSDDWKLLKVAFTFGVYIWLQSRLKKSTELLRLPLVTLVLFAGWPLLSESSTTGDWKQSTDTFDNHDHDTLMPRRSPLSLWISSALTPLVMTIQRVNCTA